MQIAICDDEPEIRKLLEEKLHRLFPDLETVAYSSGEKLIAAGRAPDILLLDIRLPGINGMETAKALREKGWDTVLIFITAMEEYVFQAFDVGAFHYLIKPFEDERFTAVLQRAIAQCREPLLLPRKQDSLLIRSKGAHIRVSLDAVIYAEVFNRKVLIHELDKEIEYYGRLSELAKQAGEDFFRPHRAYLIHFKYVVKYDSSTVWLEKGKALMAKQNYPAFVKGYLRYSRRAERGNGYVGD
ncbi:MAG: response regulator transcription factor [Provencibacterium sp.]|jgi:two-component system LytT family response regulator|nr:response regulator transcription factor [Provencibacterium sp.]